MSVKVFSGINVNLIYKTMIKSILDDGIPVNPRGQGTLELPLSIIELSNPIDNIVTLPSRKINPIFMAAEFIWMFSGFDDLAMISYYNKNMSKYSDDGIILRGAYGPRLRGWYSKDQLLLVLNKLQQDKFSRQAVIQIFDPILDYVESKDIPCNNLLKFQIRDNKLNLSVFVRSQDVIYGFPYDIFHWTLLQELFANCLGVGVGTYYHIVDSLHLYERDKAIACNILCDQDVNTSLRPLLDKQMSSYTRFLTELDFLVKLDFNLRQDIGDVKSVFYRALSKNGDNGFCLFRDFERLLILQTLRKCRPFNYENYKELVDNLSEPFKKMVERLWPLAKLKELV